MMFLEEIRQHRVMLTLGCHDGAVLSHTYCVWTVIIYSNFFDHCTQIGYHSGFVQWFTYCDS